jgi:Protein of unknown function (DUF2934)
MDDREQRIRERAFQIWIEEGQPEGKDKDHWERAEKQISDWSNEARKLLRWR